LRCYGSFTKLKLTEEEIMNNGEEIKTKKGLVQSILVDLTVAIFLVAGLWTVTHGLLMIYNSFYTANSLPEPSALGDTLFWFIEGVFFLFLAFETRKYRKIKLG
jgi:hypothetical protein